MQYYNGCASPKRKPARPAAEGEARRPPLLGAQGGWLGWVAKARTEGLGWLANPTEAGGERAQANSAKLRTEGLGAERGQRRQLATARSLCPR